MDAEFFLRYAGAATSGFCLLVCLESLLSPKSSLRRPVGAWLAQIGLWCVTYGLLCLALARPWCAVAAALAMAFVLIVVNNAKYKSLREPFLYQDYDYFLDTLRFPRLFLPFLGVKSFCAAFVFGALAIAAVVLEPPLGSLASPPLPLFALCLILGGWVCLRLSRAITPKPCGDPVVDFRRYGFFPCLWLYGLANRANPAASSPFTPVKKTRADLPNLVALQSESFFDVRHLFAGVKPGVLANLDFFRSEAFLSGALDAPAWGANTVRTESAFLTAIPPAELGVFRFNPYQSMSRGWIPAALPAYLRSLGYRCVCLHPYYGEFYSRKKIFPLLGFDSFKDYKTFANCEKVGQYVSDLALAKKIVTEVAESPGPIFVFAITMENHGPLALEKPLPREEESQYFSSAPPPECGDLSVYTRHLKNADAALGELRRAWSGDKRVSLCFYGDHVPIMPACYATLGEPSGRVPYFCWNNWGTDEKERKDIAANALAVAWLNGLGLAPVSAT